MIRRNIKRLLFHPPFNRLIQWRLPRNMPSDSVALTFDDGPSARYTPQVLACLREHRIHATFFLLGDRMLEHPEITRAIISQGHGIGIHGINHDNIAFARQVKTCRKIMADYGASSRIARPPYGKINSLDSMLLLIKGIRLIFWSFDLRDSMRHEGKTAITPSLDAIKGRDIILSHDDNPVCVRDLPAIIASLRRNKLNPVILK